MAVPKEERVVEIIVNGTKANASLKEMGAAAAVLSNQVAKIAADDPKRAELIAQLQTMRQRIGDARAEIAGLLTSEQQAAAAEQQLAASIAATAAEQQRAIEEQQRAIVVGKSSTASLTEMRTAAGLLERQLHALSADDPGRAALIADYQALKTRMGAARQEMEVTAKTEAQLRAEQDALRASQVQLVVNGQKVSASMREMREAAQQLEKELEELGQEDPARGPLIAALQEMRARIKQVNQEVVGVAETTSRMKQVMTNAFAFAVGGGIEQGIEKVVEMGKSIFTTTAKFETYGKVLENALGSKSLSQQALADIQKMAAETPFSVDELTSSFLKFVNRGLQPSMAEMGKFGDLASSQGKSFDQLAEAVLDAGTGEFERLKEFGIGASKSGDQVSFSFKGVNQTVANTPEAIKGAILAMGEMKGVAGGMASIAQGLDGQLSNLGDTADQTAIEWGQTLRPVFVAVLSTLGFLLGMLKALPGFIKENRGALLALAGAVVALNTEMVAFNVLLLQEAIQTKASLVWKAASTAATNVLNFSWKGLNATMRANPIGLVVTLVMLLVGAFITLYDKSEKVRAGVAGLGQSLLAFGKTYLQGLMEYFTALGDIMLGLFDTDRFKKGWEGLGKSLKTMYWDSGQKAAASFHDGYEAETKKREKEANIAYEATRQRMQQRIKDFLEKRAKAEADAEQKNRLEALKNEEAALRLKLAKVKEGSEQEMRLKQQLVTNEAKQQLEDTKKTAAERAIIEAEAEQKRVKLAQEFFEKQAKEAAARTLKNRLAQIEAEKLHAEMLAQVRHAAVVTRDGTDDLAAEMSKIYTEGQLKRAALEAQAKKDIVQLTGTAKEKAARQLDIERKLAADLALVDAEWRGKQGEAADKAASESAKKQEEFIDGQIDAIEEQATKQQAAIDVMFEAGLKSQLAADQAKYEARKYALENELTLIEGSLGKESARYKKAYAEWLKNEQDHGKKTVAERTRTEKQKQELSRLEMRTASDVFSFGLELLGQDEEARKKHHSLYVALAAAKILIDGATEVQRIWAYSAENPFNGPTSGAAGAVLGAIQTAIAVGRTTVALSKIGAGGSSGGDGGSYWAGGATGDGARMAVSPMGLLMQASGMSVGANGRLLDGSGFAVAGIVHEDEYVIPKWQLADPQVAAVAQWLEARRLRGFADGGATSASAVSLPAPAASPTTGEDKLYAVMTRLLEVNEQQAAQLADVKQWQRDLNVRLDLRATKSGLDEYKQVQQAGAIRSKS